MAGLPLTIMRPDRRHGPGPLGRLRTAAGPLKPNEGHMKTLLLIRHAKAERAWSGLSDHDRELDDRGRRDAPEMGRRLKQRGVVPDRMISSSALRAAATARLIAGEIGMARDGIVEDRRLYASSTMAMLYLLQELDDSLTCVALVGHNPEMTELAQHFAPHAPDMATCAVAQLDFDLASWSEVDTVSPDCAVFDSPGKWHD